MIEEKIELVATTGETENWPEILSASEYTICIFTSVQCPYALAAYRTLDRIAAKYGLLGFQFRLINSNVSTSEDPEDLEAMRALEPQPNSQFLRDDVAQLAALLGATHTPHVFVLDRTGRKLWSGPVDHRFRKPEDWTEESVGFWPWDDNPPTEPPVTRLEEVLDNLLANGVTKNEDDHPIGCSIK